MLSLSTRGSRHLWRSQTTLQSTLEEVPDCSVHFCRALTNPTVLVSSHYPDVSGALGYGSYGRKMSHCPKLVMPGGVFYQPNFSCCAVGSLNATACFTASSCIWASLSGLVVLWWGDQSSTHQLGGLSHLARYVRTHSLELSNGCGAAGSLDLALH